MNSNTYILLTVDCNKNEIEIDITKVFLDKKETDLLASVFRDFIWEVEEGSLTAITTKHTQSWTFETTSSNIEYLAFDIEQVINKTLPSQSVRINWNN